MRCFTQVLLLAAIGVALECYRGSNRYDEVPFHSKTCLETPLHQNRWCIKITNWSNVVRSCDELKICSGQGNTCLRGRIYGQLRGELCCCDSDYCNSVAQPAASSTTLFTAFIAIVCSRQMC
ncbi:hypothetical protein Tcan_04759 [Toxocara canis]|uniref:UPAR/Ly6 domain-containing protein n=1 Tax=Toxocara canis TaxID=6265 RepID=A0A0B2V0F1_TOXCA|nr:hypothetical protein Tcan_04759 [Toxocara canis]